MRLRVTATGAWQYDSESHQIIAEPIRDTCDLISSMHEIGHAYYRHATVICKPPYREDSQRAIVQECEAWGYAFKCVRAPRQFLEFARWCVASHVFHLWRESARRGGFINVYELQRFANDELDRVIL